MATFLEDFRRKFRFVGYGEAGEKFAVTGQDGAVFRMLPVIVLGKTFNFRVDSDESFAALPPEGTMLLLHGVLRRRKNSVEGLSGELSDIITAGKPGWKQPTDSDVLAGLHFEGCGLVNRKTSGTHQGVDFRNIQVASWGYTLVFKRIVPEIFDRIVEDSQSFFSGSLESKIVNSDKFVSDELIPMIEQYRLFDEKPGKLPTQEKPAA